jgi:aspartate carbamoyltransferase catalytic subunit
MTQVQMFPESVRTAEAEMPRHIIESQQFDVGLLEQIFARATHFQEAFDDKHDGRVFRSFLDGEAMVLYFWEPSTRTYMSFYRAAQNLGMVVSGTADAENFSSAVKGETLEDTIRILCGYNPSVIVMRHRTEGAAEIASKVSDVPIVNAGDGPGQHPTQALLDMYTIQREIGRLDNISIALVGDLANGRTVRSLCYLLAKFENPYIYFVAPHVVQMKDDIKDYLRRHEVRFEEVGADDLPTVAREVDALYQTRIQKERFDEGSDEYEQAKQACRKLVISRSVLECMREDAVVMHPLPRLDEINAEEVDSDPRAAYFRQAHNGMYVRMALLVMLLGR